MCLIILAIDVHPAYPLVIAANRDEYYHRPAAPLAFWDNMPDVLAGRDLVGGGTWLGVSKTGRIAAITNYRDPARQKPDARSRGLLVARFLAGDMTADTYMQHVLKEKDAYNTFNLVAGDPERIWWMSNVSDEIQQLEPGLSGISNRLLDTPWPKIVAAKSGLHDILASGPDVDVAAIFSLLSDTSAPDDRQLPDTGMGMEWERILSPIFVASDVYGTRSSSVILRHHTGKMTFWERTWQVPSPVPTPGETRRVELDIPASDIHVA
jgi:uncharacterized protein with NRDE domain